METIIIAIATVLSSLEAAFEKATDQAYSDAEELCQNAGIAIERQVWTLAFVASHLVLWRTAKQVYQNVQPLAAQKLQELTVRVQKLGKQAIVFDVEHAATPGLSDDHDKSTIDLQVEYTDEDAAVPLSLIGSSGDLPVASGFSHDSIFAIPAGTSGKDIGAVHLDDDFVALD